MEDNKRKLYDALSNEFDLGTYEEFERNIGDSVKRQKLYDAASADYDLGDFESYSQKIGPTHRENLEAFTAEHGSFLNDFEARDTAETKRMMASARSGAYMPSENAISGEERQRYMEFHKQEEALKKAWYTSDEYLAQKDADALLLSQVRDSIDQGRLEFAQANPMIEGYNPSATRGADADKEMQMYETASRIMTDAIKMHNAPGKYDGENVFLKFGKGAGDILSDADFWTAGLTEIADNFGVRSVLKSVQDKLGNLNDLSEEAIENKLSPAEKAVLQAWAINAQEQLKRKDDLSRAYQAGQGATESLGYMAEFALTGGVGKLASESVESMAKWLSKKAMTKIGGMADDVAEKVLKETGEKIANNAVGKYGTRLAESLAEAAGRTGVMPSTFRNISEKATEIRTDEEGNNYLVGMNNAFAKGFADSFIENLSEGGRVNALGELLGDVAGKIPAYRRMVDKFSNTKASELLDAFNSSGIMNTLRAGGWHGLGEEYLEEWYGNALRTLTGVDKEALKEFATVDNQIVTLTSFLPMTIFGGTVGTAQVLSATRDLEKKSAALKSALLERGYDEAQANNMIDMMRGSTPAEVSEFLSPIVNSVAGRSIDEAAALMKPVGEFAEAVRRWQAFDTKYKYQEQEQRDNLRAQMEEKLGQFWQEENGRQTVQRGINESGEMVYLLGKPSAEEAETGVPTEVAAITSDGRKVFVNPSDYELDDELEMNDFLGTEIMAEKRNKEQARMIEEKEAQIAAIREAAVPGYAVNIGTAEAPVQAIVIQRNPDGVIVNTPDGQTRQMTYEEFGNYVGINAVPLTDAQIDEQEADALSAERSQREAALDQEYNNEDAAIEELTEAENEIEQMEMAAPLPMKADGSVDQTALWNNDPARWAQWNDEQRQDGGANSLAYINGAIAKESARIAEMQAGYDAISDFDERDAVEREVAAIRERLQRLVNLRDGYIARAEAAQVAAEEVAAEQVAPRITSQMSEEEMEQADVQHQVRLDNAKSQRARREALQNYINEISEGSEPMFIISVDDYEEVMGQRGCSPRQIAQVRAALAAAKLGRYTVPAFFVPGIGTFAFQENIQSVEDARLSYVHERQHKFTRGNNAYVKAILNLGLSRERMAQIVYALSNSDFYKDDSAEVLADEIISYAMERAYTYEDFSVALQELEIEQEIIDIITNIDNEQRNEDSTYPSRRRRRYDLHDNQSNTGNGAENDRNQEPVSGGLLGSQGDRSSGDSIGRTRSTGEGAEVISDDEEAEVPTAEEVLTEAGFEADEQNEDARFSVRYLPTPEQREGIIDSIIQITGRTREEAERWLESELSLAAIVLNDKEYLDYAPDSKYKAIKDNSDYPQGTVDFNNICRKRKDFTRMYTRLQRSYSNRIFTAEDLADIRTIMSEDGLVVACGLCYVEDRRQKLGEVADEFIKDLQDGFKSYGKKNATKRANAEKFRSLVGEDTYVPSIYDLITLEGSDKLHDEHKGIWDAFGAYNRARGQQTQNTFQGYAEYKREILTWSDAKVKKVNSLGGLRIFSYSDFEAHHLLDIIQIIIDCAARGVMIQGYTKVPEFARVVEKTGIKLNRSLIPLGDTGIVDGKLAYDPVEGIDINDPNFLESNDNVGNILIGINDEQIRMAMADPFIHYIIPYHARQAGNIRAKLNVGAWTNYIDTQNERKMSDGKRVEKNINIYTDVLNESITNDREFVEKYLEVCREKGYIPKFDQFLNRDAEGNYVYTPGYYKFLVDFKLFDEAGNILPQKPVVAQFDDAFNAQVLLDYAREERETAGAAMNSTYDKIVETLDLGEPTEGEDIRFSVKDSEGPIDLVEEARKADLRHRVTAEGTLIPGHKKGQPMLSDAEMMADVSFRITKNTKATIEKWFNKAGVDAEMTEATINYLDYAFEDTTEQLCAAKWYLNGKISLPDEDEYKVRDAVKVAKQNKVDALSYASPMDILNTFGQPKSKVKAIDPDTIKEFSNKQELAEGIVVYDVQDDFEGQAAVRKIIDTHWGEDANPWCLAARTNGDLERAKDMWLHYSKYPKRIAFRNGRLLAFYASANDKTWWDRNDEPHTNIPYSVKSKEGEYEVSTNYELKEGNKKAKKVSVGKSDKKGRTAYFVGNRLESAGIQDGERNLFYSSFPAGATLSDSTYGVGRSLEVQYGPYKNVTQISFERRTKDEPTYYVRVGYGNNGVRAISFVEGARSWDIRYGINGDQIFVGRAQLNFDLTDQLSDVYSGAYHMYRINDEEYEISRGTKKVGIVRMGEKVTMQMLEAFGEDGAPAGALLDFINDNGWNRADYPYPNPADADLLRRDDEVREQIRKVENEINEIAGGRYLSSVPAIRFRVTAEQDKAYMDAVKAGDMETAQRMVIEAARLAMPNTKVVDKYGNPKIVMHLSSDEFTKFGEGINTNVVHSLGFFTDELEGLQDYHDKFFPEGFAYKCFLNFENPEVVDFKGQPYWSYKDESTGEELTTDLIAARTKREGKHDGLIMLNVGDELAGNIGDVINDFVPFIPSQIKSAEPVTYDDEGNVIPLSERFNPENEDIRFRTTRTNEQREQLFENAKNHYGLTNNFNASGYMLPDGSLLDFSEANDGGDPNSRSLDHRDIEGIIMDEGREYDSRYQYVTDFVNEGAIRMLPEYAGFQLSQAPTAEQRSKLMDYIYKYNGEVIMEITDENGGPRVYMEYNKRTSPARIFKDMDGYFNEGEVPGLPPIRFRVTEDQRDEVQFRAVSDALYEEMDDMIESLARTSFFNRVEGEFDLGKKVKNFAEFADLITIIKNNDDYIATGSSLLGFFSSHTDQHFPLLLSVDDKALRKQAEINLKEALSQIDDTYVLHFIKEAWKAHKNGLAQAGLGVKPSATTKFNKAIDARIEEIKAGRVKGTSFNFKKGEVSLDEVDALFKQLNTNEELAVLHDKVMDLAKRFDIKPQFAAIRGAAEGESLGDKVRYDYRAFNSAAISDERKANIITHELIHSVTSYAFFLDDYMPSALTPEMREAIAILRDVYSAIRRDNAFKDEYGASSVEEMVAELSNTAFREKLKEKSLYQRILDAILKLFGVVKEDSAYNAANEALTYIIENYDENAFNLYSRHAARSQEYAKWYNPEDVRFRMSNDNQAIFVSNAARAVEGIKQEKATPEQWLKMIEKNGGLKAGEDKWMGLSDWLKASNKKILTKQEVLDYINENMIIIEEQHYSDEEVAASAHKELNDKYPGWEDAFSMEWDSYMDEPYASIWDNETAVELYNDTHEDQIELDEDGEFQNMEDENKVAAFGKEIAEIYYRGNSDVRPIHGTRSDYQTRGLSDNHEIALTVPTIERWKADDAVHFGDAGDGRAIAWIRFGETKYRSAGIADEIAALDKAILEYEGETSDEEYKALVEKKHSLLRASRAQKVLVIDEIQSNRHQEGRKRGYKPEWREMKRLRENLEQADREVERIEAEIVAKYGSLDNVTSSQDFDTLKAAMEARREARLELNNPRYGAIPDAPFEKNWAELAMKRMLRYAAENGFDIIAWTTGDQQANRYDLSRDVIKINAYRPNAEGERIVSIYYRDEYNDYKTLTVDKEGKVVQGDYNGSALADVVGKEMALQIMNAEDVTEFKGDGLKIGGEGMRGFYDKMLPAFMRKYGKKWGVTVEDINLPNLGKSGYTMHSVPVTEEMKASVMEGQVMFRTTAITPEVQDEMNAIHASAIVMGNFMKAPNGQPTNLTEEQWLMVRTKSFKEWFGDWENDPENASKVVDENGEPKVVFHGGAWRPLLEEKGNAVFKMRSGLMGRGAYFTDNFTTAADYAREKYEWENYQEVDEDFVYDNGYITEAFLNIRNEDDIREYYGETFYLATSPNQIKSAIDNTGEFSEGEGDIRFKVVTDSAKIEELESGEKIKVYRAMQLIDGKLYPPMSAKVDGQLREPIELGQWEEAEERPDLADNKGYFKLDKGNKKSLKARYNPYFHTSYTPLNDQFSEAQDRPNLVTVEVEIPVSELTSGYKADKAKDSVGEKEWKAGVIQGKLSGTRKVILSRWDKPIRIVPDSEVADVIVKMFEGKDIVMPSNVVTPSLRAELESRGVPFVETDNQGKKLTNIAEMTTPIWSSKGTFANLAEAEEWAHKNLQGKSRVNRYTGERISIGSNSISKMLSPKAQKQSSSISAHLAALKSVLDFIKTGIPAEVHADQEGRDFNVLRLYNAIEIDNKLYRVKSTVRKVRQGDKFYTYEVQEMELIEERWSSQKGEADNPRNPDSPINSITGAKLLKGVKKSNSNENILPESENVSFRVNENPTEAQKEAGNYKMGHLNLDGYRITIENPKGSVRRGTDSKGNAWENTLNNDYGYIRGTEGVDGDHIDVYLSDNPSEGNVFVIDQVNPQTREFDEHKVMYGFNSAEEAREAYLANFSEGWNGLGIITEVSKDEFKKWIQSSHRKTKPFSEYKSVNAIGMQSEEMSEEITTGTPTEDVVAEGVSLSPAQLASLAGDIFAALPEDVRKKITDGLNGNILGLQNAILQIPTSLATKEEWNDEDRQMAEVVAEQMTKAVGIEMTRPFSASEALWTLYNAVNKSTDLVSEASRALVRRNLGFDSQTLEMEKDARDGVRFRTVGNASANAQASMYNRGAANVWTRLKESFVDMHASVEELVKAIEKRSGKVAEGFENILMALNQQSSKGLAAMEAYEQKFLNKMFDEIRKIMDKTDFKYEDIVRYVILKHGLERNVKMAQRDAKAHYQEIYDDIIAKIKGMNPAQKRTYLTNAQLRDADAKAELARLQAVNTSALTPDQLRDHKKELAKAKTEAAEAAEHLVRAQKIATMTEQDAQDELDKIFDNINNESDSVYKEMRKNDYSGISSMFYDTLGVDRKNYATEEEYQAALMQAKADKYDNLGDIEGAAQTEVTLFENAVNTDNLWKSINKATKETLRQQYDANMISKDQYLNLRDMFEYYVPLRGFADNTAEDMYTYYRRPNSTGYTKPILGAEGRKTEAESPFGWIAAMAGSAIASNVKNEAKLALYYFVANRPDNGIATLSRTWFVHTPGDVDANGKKIFRPAYPPFNEGLSTDASKQAYEDWQEQMRDLQKQGLAYEAGQRLNLGNSVVNISDSNKPEHIVNVKVGGKDYTIVINGNPRAAQEINGDLNIEATAQDYSTVFGPMLRWMSSVNTSYNPEFWITNMMRDMAFTMMAVNIKEDPAYRRKFKKNYAKAFKVISMVAKNENGTLGNSYIERMYKDFVKYGGVTGYTQIKDSETWEKEIENYLTSNDPASIRNGKAMRGVKSVFHAAHRFGESLEQVSRFAAFLTAVETGKSINEAINDAKEITVNFNRKGSGKMITLEEAKYLTDRNGQPLNKFEQWAVVGISSIAPLGRRFIMFFNAAIQGLNATYKLWKKNKMRSMGWALGYAAVGMMNAVLHALMDDDDDYLDIPQYERRNSLMIGGNGAYFKWALPQEARAFYALGDLAVESVMGRNPHQSALAEALKISTEILPINPSEGWKAFMPSIAIPFVELALNEDYKGAPIYNEQKWLTEEEKKRSTKWSKAYSGTGKIYIDIAKALNAATGGDKHDAGLVNLQPEKIEHIVQSAFGGTIRTADKFISTILAAIDPEEDITIRQFPFLNRILTINDERYKNVHVNDVYDYYAAEAEHVISLQKQYTKDRNPDALKDLKSSDEYKWARIYSKYKKPIKKYQEAIRAADTTKERMELMKQQDELRREMIKEISDL